MNPLSLSVVGHTNTGKTSLMRTILRDGGFGEVANAAATTRHVEEAAVTDGADILVRLYDTPGLEDAGGVLDWLEEHTDHRQDGIERIGAFLDSEAARSSFSQEAKVLRQMLAGDTALYVIDAREPVLAKYKDELSVLSWCARPIMPVFNFTAGQDTSEWQAVLARRGLHIFSRFDTVAFDFESEMQLWLNLAAMLPERAVIERLTAVRRRERERLDEDARRRIAGFLLDAAAYRQTADGGTPEALRHAVQSAVRSAERQMQQDVLHLYRFYRNSLDTRDWELQAFARDPFDSELLKDYGIRTTTGAAAGALIGLGVDSLTLGTSLGLASAVGGLIGSLVPNWQTISDKLSGVETLYLDAPALTVLAARALGLLHTLQHSGHAAEHALAVSPAAVPWQPEKLPAQLRLARARPQWSALNGSTADSPSRREAVAGLAAALAYKAA